MYDDIMKVREGQKRFFKDIVKKNTVKNDTVKKDNVKKVIV
jgi:hypothetical protein